MESPKHALSHFDESQQPRMVDVSEKSVTTRTAEAEARVRFPVAAWAELEAADFVTRKGGLRDVAVIAGTMGVKRTSELIPFCHPLPVDGVSFTIDTNGEERCFLIRCTVKTCGRTGVEMEALSGATTAALTLYDMTKALSHEICIEQVRLLRKTGGKSDFQAS